MSNVRFNRATVEEKYVSIRENKIAKSVSGFVITVYVRKGPVAIT